MDCIENYGDHIYDTYSDVSNVEIADFKPLGQPNIEEADSENLHDIL
jgi:hypothetical protein